MSLELPTVSLPQQPLFKSYTGCFIKYKWFRDSVKGGTAKLLERGEVPTGLVV